MLKKRLSIFGVSLLMSFIFMFIFIYSVLSKTNGNHQVHLPIIFRPIEHWISVYGSAENEVGKFIFATQDGGSILLIEQGSNTIGETDDNFLIVKLATDGTMLWQKFFDVPGGDFNISGIETSDGEIIVSGLGGGSTDAWVIRLTSEGYTVWQKRYGGWALDFANAIQETNDGGFIFTGYTATYGNGISALWVVKLNQNGNIMWQKTFTNNISNYGTSIQQTNDGGFIVGGYTGGGDWIYDLWVMRLDSSGSIIWQKTFGGTEQDYGKSVIQTGDDYIIVGSTESVGAGGSDAWVMRLNSDGEVIWQKAYGGISDDVANSIHSTSDGQFIIAGTTSSFGAGGSDGWVFKLDSEGNITWQQTYGGTDDDSTNSIQTIDNGKYLVAGSTESFGVNDSDAWAMKLDPTGDVQDCNLIEGSMAIITITTLNSQIENIQSQTSQADPIDTNYLITNSPLQMSQLCPSQ